MPARQYTARRLHLGCCACLLLLVSYRPLALDAPRAFTATRTATPSPQKKNERITN